MASAVGASLFSYSAAPPTLEFLCILDCSQACGNPPSWAFLVLRLEAGASTPASHFYKYLAPSLLLRVNIILCPSSRRPRGLKEQVQQADQPHHCKNPSLGQTPASSETHTSTPLTTGDSCVRSSPFAFLFLFEAASEGRDQYLSLKSGFWLI